MIINLTYDPINGDVVPDGRIDEWIDNLCSNNSQKDSVDVCIGSETILVELRARHSEKRLNLGSSLVYIDNNNNYDFVLIGIDKEGKLDYFPRGFCDYVDKALERLLRFY